MRDVAREKAKSAKSVQPSTQSQTPKYRDRASERRVMHNQPDVPLPESSHLNNSPSNAGSGAGNLNSGKRRHAEGPPPPPSPPPPPINPGQDTNNVGNKLLKMMGWKEGTGLGTDGEGRVEPMLVSFLSSVDSLFL